MTQLIHKNLSSFIDKIGDFESLSETDKILNLTYFYTQIDNAPSINIDELKSLFIDADLGVPRNLRQLVAYLVKKRKLFPVSPTNWRLNLKEKKRIKTSLFDINQRGRVPQPASFLKFNLKIINDKKIKVLLKELAIIYKDKCWNASGILIRIILERLLDRKEAKVKARKGLENKLDYCISNNNLFGRSIRECLKQLRNAKIIGDIVAHDSSIILDQGDIDICLPALRILVKDIYKK